MPVKGDELGGKDGRHGRIGGRRHPLHGVPADFLVRIGINLGAQDIGDELGAKADAEKGRVLFQAPGDEMLLGSHPWMGQGVMNPHGAAHHHHQLVLGSISG